MKLETVEQVIETLDDIKALSTNYKRNNSAYIYANYYYAPTKTTIVIHQPEVPFDRYTSIICQMTITVNDDIIPITKFLLQIGTEDTRLIDYIKHNVLKLKE